MHKTHTHKIGSLNKRQNIIFETKHSRLLALTRIKIKLSTIGPALIGRTLIQSMSHCPESEITSGGSEIWEKTCFRLETSKNSLFEYKVSKTDFLKL